MLAVSQYSQSYIDECRTKVNTQLAAYRNLASSSSDLSTTTEGLDLAIQSFAPVFFNNMTLVLDHYFLHRSRELEGKDGNPANEVRVICKSIMENNAVMMADKTIKMDPEKSVLHYKVGDEIRLSESDFVKLSGAFFTEIEKRYSEAGNAK